MPRQIYQLRVTLLDVSPPVWRRTLVPGGYTLDRVHRVVRYAMGWQGLHPHWFDIGGWQYGEPDSGELRDELDARLADLAVAGETFRYVYHPVEWWEHEVAVEDVTGAEPWERYPVCVAGERACPPEDVGGPRGYEELLTSGGPDGSADAPVTDRVGRGYDPTRFDPVAVTTLLRWLT